MAGRISAKARAAATAGGWLLAAVVATAAGMFAIGAIGDDLAPDGQRPLDERQVAALAETRSPTATPAPPSDTPPPSRPDSAGTKVLGSRGGTVLARCTGSQVRILTASPAQGFRVDERDDEADDSAEVTFTGAGAEIEVKVRCADGVPRASVKNKGDDDD